MNIKSSLLVTFKNVFVSKSCHINIIFIISCNAALLYIMLIHIVLFQNYVLLVSDCSLYAAQTAITQFLGRIGLPCPVLGSDWPAMPCFRVGLACHAQFLGRTGMPCPAFRRISLPSSAFLLDQPAMPKFSLVQLVIPSFSSGQLAMLSFSLGQLAMPKFSLVQLVIPSFHQVSSLCSAFHWISLLCSAFHLVSLL